MPIHVANTPIKVYGAAAASLNGKIYLLGGSDCTNAKDRNIPMPTNSVFVHDPAGDSWSTGLSMPVTLPAPDANFSVTTANGKIFLI